jgi:hypothetical protein
VREVEERDDEKAETDLNNEFWDGFIGGNHGLLASFFLRVSFSSSPRFYGVGRPHLVDYLSCDSSSGKNYSVCYAAKDGPRYT